MLHHKTLYTSEGYLDVIKKYYDNLPAGNIILLSSSSSGCSIAASLLLLNSLNNPDRNMHHCYFKYCSDGFRGRRLFQPQDPMYMDTMISGIRLTDISKATQYYTGYSWVIVDDLVDCGHTIKGILDKLGETYSEKVHSIIVWNYVNGRPEVFSNEIMKKFVYLCPEECSN